MLRCVLLLPEVPRVQVHRGDLFTLLPCLTSVLPIGVSGSPPEKTVGPKPLSRAGFFHLSQQLNLVEV